MDKSAKRQEVERLLQVRRGHAVEKPADQAFVCIYSSESLRDGFHCFSYLLPLDQKDRFLSDVGWDLRNDNFRPSVQCEERYVDGKPERRVFYMPYGNESSAEAIRAQTLLLEELPERNRGRGRVSPLLEFVLRQSATTPAAFRREWDGTHGRATYAVTC